MRILLMCLSLATLLLSGCIYIPGGEPAGEPPVIKTFDANPDTVPAGTRSQLTWSVSGARTVKIDNGIGPVAVSGMRSVMPTGNTIYTLTATNPSGTATATTQVNVSGSEPLPGAAPVISSFTASQYSVAPQGATLLSWTISNATSATIDQGIGPVNRVSGTQTVTPGLTTTYTLTAANAAGSVASAVTITVTGGQPGPGFPVVNSFDASPSVLPLGGSTTLSWNVSNASQVMLMSGLGSFLVVEPVGSITATPPSSTNYTLTASNAIGQVTKAVQVTVGGGGDGTPPHVPVLISPADGATLPQPSSPWDFDWVDSSDAESGIQKYQIYVIRAGAGSPAIDAYPANSSYSKAVGGAIQAPFLNNWTWKVRVQNGAGIWSDWSPTRTFNVEPPPSVSHTVNLGPVAGETGAVYKDGTVATGTKFVGDTSGNVAIRCFFSYDIAVLAGKDVTDAKLKLSVNSFVRDPFGHLGGLYVAKVNYGVGPLQAADYGLMGVAFAPATGSVPAEVDVTTIVKNMVIAGESRFQTRLSFTSETNGDNLADYINFSNAVLTVTYND